jgi:hypothetical protein
MTMSTIARSHRPAERCALISAVPQTYLMSLVDLPELLRPWVRAFIADKTIVHPTLYRKSKNLQLFFNIGIDG